MSDVRDGWDISQFPPTIPDRPTANSNHLPGLVQALREKEKAVYGGGHRMGLAEAAEIAEPYEAELVALRAELTTTRETLEIAGETFLRIAAVVGVPFGADAVVEKIKKDQTEHDALVARIRGAADQLRSEAIPGSDPPTDIWTAGHASGLKHAIGLIESALTPPQETPE